MRIAIPVSSNSGPQAAVSGHFGHAPFFAVIEQGLSEVQFIAKIPHSRGHGGGCAPTDELKAAGVTRVLCKGLGQGAHTRLTGEGISVGILDGPYENPAQVLAALEAGTLKLNEAPVLCAGHGEHEHHHH